MQETGCGVRLTLETVVGVQPDDRFRVYMAFASRCRISAQSADSDIPRARAARSSTSVASTSARTVKARRGPYTGCGPRWRYGGAGITVPSIAS